VETSHDDMRLLTHPLDGLAQLGPQVRQVKAAEVAQFHSLKVRSQSLSRVEVGSIAGKPFEVDALGGSVSEKVADCVTAVDRRAVPEDEELARDHLQKVLEKADDGFGVERLLLHG
jgi:hypothetical protein